MNVKYKFISSTLPYLNSTPHIGHCFEFVLCDVIARFYRQNNYQVLFNTGVDEHGIKVQQAAVREGIDPQSYCDQLAKKWKDFCHKFDISYNNFYRTSSEFHKFLTEKIFYDYFAGKPFCHKDTYKGKYCVGCESFITEKEIIEKNRCPIHLTELKELEEKNHFLSLHYFTETEGWLKNVLVNEKLQTELSNIIKEFDRISITRKGVEWGVKLNDDTVLYVWFEALLNYIIAAGFITDDTHIWKELWESSLIVCGKDNLKFQAYILQCICLALKIPQSKEVFVHGTILDKDGIKMSKTIGNVIDPIEQLNKYGVSPVRFYLFWGLHPTEDSCYDEDKLIELWNTNVVNGYGNLVTRVLHLIDIKKINIDENNLTSEFAKEIHAKIVILNGLFYSFKFIEFKEYLNNFIFELNKRINDEKPYDKNCENVDTILNELYFSIKIISTYYKIIIPEYEEKIDKCLSKKKKEILFQRLEYVEL